MKKKYFYLLTTLVLMMFSTAYGQVDQTKDARFIREIYNDNLLHGDAYDWLRHLCKEVGGRLAGSPQSAAAIAYGQHVLDTTGFDSVYLQACTVPTWVRGEEEQLRIVNSKQIGTQALHSLALGHSIGTGPDGLTAAVIEVGSLDEVDELGAEQIKGKIVFFNRPMDATQLRTYNAYGGAVDQRVYGASKASAYGAVGVLVRSMTTRLDDFPHTGALVYDEGVPAIPALAISTNDAELLSRLLKHEEIQVFMRSTCRSMGETVSYNVVGEIKGSENPDEIILIGGHLDAWDVGEGAHDDGAGCVQAMQVWQTLRRLEYRPKHTLRCVLFMNEESGLGGAKAYWAASKEAEEYHMAAIESDRGGFTPRGFTFDAHEEVFTTLFQQVYSWSPLLESYGLTLRKGGSGADISGLKYQKGLLVGYEPDSQRYFDFHHTTIDTFEAVNKRELEQGAAAITALVYLLDKYGLVQDR